MPIESVMPFSHLILSHPLLLLPHPPQHQGLFQQVHIVKTLFFPVIMYGCESWTIKKAERQITDAIEL